MSWPSGLRTAGLVLIVAEIVLVSVVFDRSALDVFVMPKALLARSSGLLLLALLFALLVTGPRHVLRWSPLHAPVAVFLGIYVLATVFALDPSLALAGAHDRQLGLVTVGSFVALYFAAASFLRSERDLRAVGAGVAAASAAVTGYGFVQWLGWDPFSWAADPSVRTFSTVGNPTTLGLYLVTVAAAVLGSALLAPLARRRRLVLVAFAAVLVLGAVTTGTRAIVLGLLAGGVVLAIFVWLRLPAGRSRAALAVSYIVTFIVLGTVVLSSSLGERLALLTSPVEAGAGPVLTTRDPSVGGRVVLYEVAVQEVFERPLLGVGPDNYSARFPALRPERAIAILQTTAPETSPHSWLLKLATDAGILGAGAYVAILLVAGFLVLRSGRPWAGTVALVTLATFLGAGIVSTPDVSTEWLPWLALGVLASATRPAVDDRRSNEGGRRRALVGIIMTAGVLLALTSLVPWDANRAAEAARRARARGDYAAALPLSERAVALDSWPAAYWHGRGLAEIRANAPNKAAASFTAAVEREPYNAAYLGSLARAQALLGQSGNRDMTERALETARRAVREDPNNADGHFTTAVVLLVSGNPAEAATASERGLALNPPRLPDESVPNAAARAYLALGRPADAERWARFGLVHFGRSVDLRLSLAQALLELDRPSEALGVVNEVLAAQLGNAAALSLKTEIGRRVAGPAGGAPQ